MTAEKKKNKKEDFIPYSVWMSDKIENINKLIDECLDRYKDDKEVNNQILTVLSKLKEMIEKKYKEKKRPSDYASLLCISPNYLNKICKEETGLTAGELIRKRIIIEAQRLLYYTNYSVNEVANKLGFDNASYFVTFFKKNTNQTTEQFRKNQYT